MNQEHFKEDQFVFKNNYNPMIGFSMAEKIADYFTGHPPLDLQDDRGFIKFFHEIQGLETLVRSGEKITPVTLQKAITGKAEEDLILRAKAVVEDYQGHSLIPTASTIQALLYAYILIEKTESDKRFWAERKG